jgi:hypothetical protein
MDTLFTFFVGCMVGITLVTVPLRRRPLREIPWKELN